MWPVLRNKKVGRQGMFGVNDGETQQVKSF